MENANGAAVRALSDARLETSLAGAAARGSDSHQGGADHLALEQRATHSVPLRGLRGHARPLAADALRAGVASWTAAHPLRAQGSRGRYGPDHSMTPLVRLRWHPLTAAQQRALIDEARAARRAEQARVWVHTPDTPETAPLGRLTLQ